MEDYFKTAISLPIYPNLTNKELKKFVIQFKIILEDKR